MTDHEGMASLRGHEARYGVVGDGPPVLLVMGFGMSGRAWKPIVDVLKDRWTLCWYDARGLGESTVGALSDHHLPGLADDAAALLDHLGWDTAHVAGISMGGMIAQHLALRHRPRLRSLSLIATHGGGGLRATAPSLHGIRLFLRANRSTGEARLEALRAVLYADPSRVTQRFDADELARLASPSPLGVRVRHLRSILTHDARPGLRGLDDLRALVVQPGMDVLVPPRCSEVLADVLPDATLVRLPDVGHGVVVEATDRLASALDEHWTNAGA